MTKAQADNQEVLLRRYLLGMLSEDQQRVIEQRLMIDQEFFQQLLRIEEELIDEYVRGDIPLGEKPAFESHFLQSPQHRDDVEFSQMWQRYLVSRKGPKELSHRRSRFHPDGG